MTIQHQELAAGRWLQFSLCEQLGNIGSEVHRAASTYAKSQEDFQAAFRRAFELIDLTLADSRHRGRRKEIARLREILCDAAGGGEHYRTTLEDVDRYLLQFATAVKLHRG